MKTDTFYSVTVPLRHSDKVSASRAIDLSSIPVFSVGIFSGLSHTIDLKIGISVAKLPGAC